jgi:hypothetical protein
VQAQLLAYVAKVEAIQRIHMRAPFFMDGLSPEDQRKARRIYFGMLFGYTAIVLLVFAIVIVDRQLSDSSANAKPCAAMHVTSGAASQTRRGDCGHEIKVNTNILTRKGRALS